MQTNTAGAPMILETRDLFVCQVFSHAQGRGEAKILGKLLKTSYIFYLFLVCFILSRSWEILSVLVWVCIALSVPIWAKSHQMHINIHLYESLYLSIMGGRLTNYCHCS